MKLHPVNPTPGIPDIPPPPSLPGITTADVLDAISAIMMAVEVEGAGKGFKYRQKAWDKLNELKGKL